MQERSRKDSSLSNLRKDSDIESQEEMFTSPIVREAGVDFSTVAGATMNMKIKKCQSAQKKKEKSKNKAKRQKSAISAVQNYKQNKADTSKNRIISSNNNTPAVVIHTKQQFKSSTKTYDLVPQLHNQARISRKDSSNVTFTSDQ